MLSLFQNVTTIDRQCWSLAGQNPGGSNPIPTPDSLSDCLQRFYLSFKDNQMPHLTGLWRRAATQGLESRFCPTWDIPRQSTEFLNLHPTRQEMNKG